LPIPARTIGEDAGLGDEVRPVDGLPGLGVVTGSRLGKVDDGPDADGGVFLPGELAATIIRVLLWLAQAQVPDAGGWTITTFIALARASPTSTPSSSADSTSGW